MAVYILASCGPWHLLSFMFWSTLQPYLLLLSMYFALCGVFYISQSNMYFFVIYFTGYQYDYVFDWTVLKYPQIGSNTRSRVCVSSFAIMYFFPLSWCPLIYLANNCYFLSHQQPSGRTTAVGPSADRAERTSGFISSIFISFPVVSSF